MPRDDIYISDKQFFSEDALIENVPMFHVLCSLYFQNLFSS